MVKFSYHQRVLPSPPAIDFASNEGKKLFCKAFLAGTMVGFFKLICCFQTQSELTYCGLASLAMVLNALHIDPGRTWKDPWRWFHESMLGSPEQLEKVKAEGISFWEVAKLALDSGAEVEAFQTSRTDVDFFRRSVKECSSSDNCHLVSSYDRATLKQAGSGHFSPIGGYHEGSDMVLILDVARFKYPPHWVPLNLLWKAMDTVDKTTRETRGFMLISKPKRDTGLLYTLDERPAAFKSRKLKDAQRRYIFQEKVDPNPVIDALSRPYCHCFKKGLKHDQRAQNRIGYAREIKIRCEKDLCAKVPQQYVPLLKKLRKELLCKRHDSKWAWPSSKINTIGLRCGTTLKRT